MPVSVHSSKDGEDLAEALLASGRGPSGWAEELVDGGDNSGSRHKAVINVKGERERS